MFKKKDYKELHFIMCTLYTGSQLFGIGGVYDIVQHIFPHSLPQGAMGYLKLLTPVEQVQCFTETTVQTNTSKTNESRFLHFYYRGIQSEKWKATPWALCFWRFGVKAPFLDGSTVLTNFCTDMELYSNQQTVSAVFQSLECNLSENDGI